MTADDTLFTAADMRRAAALLTHYAAADLPGVRAILTEAYDAGGALDLAAALAALFFQVIPGADSAEGRAALRELTRSYAAQEADEGGPS